MGKKCGGGACSNNARMEIWFFDFVFSSPIVAGVEGLCLVMLGCGFLCALSGTVETAVSRPHPKSFSFVQN